MFTLQQCVCRWALWSSLGPEIKAMSASVWWDLTDDTSSLSLTLFHSGSPRLTVRSSVQSIIQPPLPVSCPFFSHYLYVWLVLTPCGLCYLSLSPFSVYTSINTLYLFSPSLSISLTLFHCLFLVCSLSLFTTYQCLINHFGPRCQTLWCPVMSECPVSQEHENVRLHKDFHPRWNFIFFFKLAKMKLVFKLRTVPFCSPWPSMLCFSTVKLIV